MTDTEAKKFYDSKAWQTKRIEILKRDRFECQDCRARIQKAVAKGKWLPEKEKKIARAEQVHHIQELKEHPELALDNDNLISLCVRCHNIRHGRVPHKFKRKKKLVSRKSVGNTPRSIFVKFSRMANGHVGMTPEKF